MVLSVYFSKEYSDLILDNVVVLSVGESLKVVRTGMSMLRKIRSRSR